MKRRSWFIVLDILLVSAGVAGGLYWGGLQSQGYALFPWKQEMEKEGRELSLFGQLLMVGISGLQVDQVARELVQDLRVGGVILSAPNIAGPEQLWQLTRDLQRQALAATGRPLLIAVNQEGGRVQRLKAPFTQIPPARELGTQETPARVEAMARILGQEMRLVGINVNLAPVMDVAGGPDCPLGDRSYGADPERVAAFGVAAIKGFLASGVIPVAKHFPGLGDTHTDSHEDLPEAQSGDPRREMDLLPFRQAVAAGLPMMMTAHLLVPAWDSHPATLSPVALQHWLRRDLGFAGVIITDDLEMKAITNRISVPQAAKEALMAGADLLLISNDWRVAWETARFLAQQETLAPLVQEKIQRLNRLKRGLQVITSDIKNLKDYFHIKEAQRDNPLQGHRSP